MKARIVVAVDGTIAVFVDEGTFAQAAEFSRRLLEAIAADIDINIVLSEPEQHRHGHEHVHAHSHVHTHAQ